MPALRPPAVEIQQSFLAAMTEFQAEGRGGPDDHTMVGDEIRGYRTTWSTDIGFAEYLRWLNAQALMDTPRPEGHVPSTTLWWVDGSEYLGRIAIRHWLTPALYEVGGHIGYDVRPSARRRGQATAMLAAALPVARRLSIESALVTCDVDNIGSRMVIERNAGALEDQRNGKLRFWLPLA